MTDASAKDVLLWCLFAFTFGRIAGAGLMYLFESSILLAIFAAGGAIAAVIAAANGGVSGVMCLVAASFFWSILFPTIFASSVRDLDGDTKTGAAMLMFAAGSGAAVLALLNVLIGPDTVRYVMIVPSLCFAAITGFALVFRKADRAARTLA